jgi:hypothetical protein
VKGDGVSGVERNLISHSLGITEQHGSGQDILLGKSERLEFSTTNRHITARSARYAGRFVRASSDILVTHIAIVTGLFRVSVSPLATPSMPHL